MRIIYFCYCDDEGLLHEYNLQQGVSIAKVGARKFAVASSNTLSKAFFSYQNRDNITISAIIGANGSGKTSFARLICKLAEEQSIHAVLVLEDEGVFCVVRNIPAEFIAQDKGAESVAVRNV